MNKQDVLSFGVPEERYREFQTVYNRELRRAAERIKPNEGEAAAILEAITAMMKLIKRPETLQRILTYINKQYYSEP